MTNGYISTDTTLEMPDADAAALVMVQLQSQTRTVGSRLSGNISVVDDIAGKNSLVVYAQIIFSYMEVLGMVRSGTVYTDGSGNYTTNSMFPTDLTGTFPINWKIIAPVFTIYPAISAARQAAWRLLL